MYRCCFSILPSAAVILLSPVAFVLKEIQSALSSMSSWHWTISVATILRFSYQVLCGCCANVNIERFNCRVKKNRLHEFTTSNFRRGYCVHIVFCVCCGVLRYVSKVIKWQYNSKFANKYDSVIEYIKQQLFFISYGPILNIIKTMITRC